MLFRSQRTTVHTWSKYLDEVKNVLYMFYMKHKSNERVKFNNIRYSGDKKNLYSLHYPLFKEKIPFNLQDFLTQHLSNVLY